MPTEEDEVLRFGLAATHEHRRVEEAATLIQRRRKLAAAAQQRAVRMKNSETFRLRGAGQAEK